MTTEKLEHYMKLPWTYTIKPDFDEVKGDYFQSSILELDGCFSNGKTYEEAWNSLQEALRGYLQVKLKFGDKIPEPIPHEYSGNFRLRVPPSLHKHLAELAAAENTSLNTYCLYKLSKP